MSLMVDEREGRKRLFGLETHNQTFRNLNSLNSMEEANNIKLHSLISSTNQKKEFNKVNKMEWVLCCVNNEISGIKDEMSWAVELVFSWRYSLLLPQPITNKRTTQFNRKENSPAPLALIELFHSLNSFHN